VRGRTTAMVVRAIEDAALLPAQAQTSTAAK
jgi:hypothetical protein